MDTKQLAQLETTISNVSAEISEIDDIQTHINITATTDDELFTVDQLEKAIRLLQDGIDTLQSLIDNN